MNNRKVRFMTEGGLMLALSALLSNIIIYQAPNGGSVSAGSMIPLLIFAIRWGTLPGVLLGGLYGILDFLLKPYFYHPVQFLLDYPVAFGLIGLAGIAKMDDSKTFNLGIILGVGVAMLGRLVAHTASGAVFFAEYAGGQNPWLYSIGYNATYLIPEFIISSIILVIIWNPLKKVWK